MIVYAVLFLSVIFLTIIAYGLYNTWRISKYESDRRQRVYERREETRFYKDVR